MQEISYYPLTSPQLSIWYTEKTYPGTSISNVAGTLRIKNLIDYTALERAVNCFIRNNDGIRTKICLNDEGQPRQYISDYQYETIDFIDFSNFDDPVGAMFEWDKNLTLKPFLLIDHTLYKFIIFKLSDYEGGFYINTHHIISDAWTMSLLGSSIVRYYGEFIKNEHSNCSLLPQPSFVTSIQNEQLYMGSNRYKNDRFFWEQQFSKPFEVTSLKSQKNTVIATESKRKTFILPKKFINALRDYCSKSKVSPFPLFLSALFLYINRVTGKEDIIVGTPILNRLNQVEKNTIGMFISTIPLRINLKNDDSFIDLSQSVIDLCSSAYRHQKYPYNNLLKHVRDTYALTGNLYDIVLSYQNSKFHKNEDVNYSTRWHFNGHQIYSLAIHINDRDDEDQFIIDYDYQKELFFDKEIEFIHHHLLSLLWHAIDSPQKKVSSLDMLPENEKKKVLHDFNNTLKDFPAQVTIQELFEEQVFKTPSNIAIAFENRFLSYHELNQKSNALARILIRNGVTKDSIVGVMLNRSLEMIISILAILKAGGAYLPIDPDYPQKRIDFMLLDCKVQILLASKSIDLSHSDNSVVRIDVDTMNFDSENTDNLMGVGNYEDLAYVIYTSGSTGMPKGVLIEQRSVVNFVYGMYQDLDFSKINSVLSIGSFSFDIFMIELLPALFTGATVVLSNDYERKDPQLLADIIKNHSVDLVVSTPSQMQQFIKDQQFCKSINKVYEIVLGGESVSESLLNSLKECTDALILNVYGPTETTVVVTTKELSKTNKITIGKPLPNTQVYILDKNLLPVPIGIEGEIYIGGLCLSRGYNNRNDLNTERFINSPFSQGELLYKTGDLARWYPKGEIEYLGRSDFQVKIRGLRIELGEIEKRLLQLKDVRKAIVVAIDDDGSKAICAYYIADKALSANRIRSYLKRFLPSYMVPAYFVKLEDIPLSPNGKVDIMALPKPRLSQLQSKKKAMPRNRVEKEILEVWQSTLRTSNFGVQDDFYDIGGDSLSIIEIASKLYTQYDINIPICTMNKMNTVEKMAKFIVEKENVVDRQTVPSLVKLKEGIRSNLFLIHAGNGEVSCYNELSFTINDDFTVWGLMVDDSLLVDQKNWQIESLAQVYVQLIKDVQKEGPYYLGGWCIGGSIAFEMASILEKNNDIVKYLGLYNSIAPQNWGESNLFNENHERAILFRSLSTIVDTHVLEHNTMEQNWFLLLNNLKNNIMDAEAVIDCLPQNIKVVLPDICFSNATALARYLLRILALHKARASYYPQNKVTSPVYFFTAIDDYNISDHRENRKRWHEYCLNSMVNHNLKANHYTLLSAPTVGVIGKMTNNYINNYGIEMKYNG